MSVPHGAVPQSCGWGGDRTLCGAIVLVPQIGNNRSMLDTSKLVDSDKLAAAYLASELNSGSTRVFNVDRLHRAILRDGAPRDEHLFRHPELHRIIFIKQALIDPNYQKERHNRIGTKLYFAFNEANAFEGGKSIFAGDPQFDDAMAFQLGFERGKNMDDYIRDRDVIQILDSLPSLDPFLMRDRLEAEGLAPHLAYFEIEEEEWSQIREHVMRRFKPIVDFAFGGSDATKTQARLRSLVQKIWEAKDMEGLKPILSAMELTSEDAPKALHAWKGVIYYDYRMTRLEARVRELATWLTQSATPSDMVPSGNAKIVAEIRDAVRHKVRDRWQRARGRLLEYNDAYTALFVDKRSPGPFINFLGNASDIFNELGDELSRLDHASEVRRVIADRYFGGRLKYEPLHDLLSVVYRILE